MPCFYWYESREPLLQFPGYCVLEQRIRQGCTDSDKNRDSLLRERNVLLDMRQRAGQDEKLKGPGPGEPFVDHLHSVCLLLCGWFA